MRFSTWNVASLKARMPRVEPWLTAADCDVLCVQETKMKADAFPTDAFAALGYESVHHGQGQWNGVAILSRVGVEATTHGFGGLDDPYEGDARLVSARCGGVRAVGHDTFDRDLSVGVDVKAGITPSLTFVARMWSPGRSGSSKSRLSP